MREWPAGGPRRTPAWLAVAAGFAAVSFAGALVANVIAVGEPWGWAHLVYSCAGLGFSLGLCVKWWPRAAPVAAPVAADWPIPDQWPNGKCACHVCQADAGVKHTCGLTEGWQTCDCWRPGDRG